MPLYLRSSMALFTRATNRSKQLWLVSSVWLSVPFKDSQGVSVLQVCVVGRKFDKGNGCQLLTKLLQDDHSLKQGHVIHSGEARSTQNHCHFLSLLLRRVVFVIRKNTCIGVVAGQRTWMAFTPFLYCTSVLRTYCIENITSFSVHGDQVNHYITFRTHTLTK